MKQQQHDINYEEDSEKNPSPRWDSVVGSNPIWDSGFFPSPPHN